MRIGFIVARPTQFEAPFYRFVKNSDPVNHFDIFFLNAFNISHYDQETGIHVKWGPDLYEGYNHVFLRSPNKCNEFLKYLNKPYSLVIINGYKNRYKGFAELCRALNIPVALRLDTVLFNQSAIKMALRKLFLVTMYKKFDHFLVTGKASKHYLLEMGIKKEEISIFSYCIDNSFFGKGRNKETAVKPFISDNSSQIILVVAKFIKRESPLDVIRAFSKLNRRDLKLIIAGEGKERSLLEKEAGNLCGTSIIFTGFVEYCQLPGYYNSSKLFIHTARDEPWGVSVQEAIAGGCRIICSDKVGSAQDMICEGKNGFIYRAGHYSELADRIEDALRIPEEVVNETNKRILKWWNFTTMWKEILGASQKLHSE